MRKAEFAEWFLSWLILAAIALLAAPAMESGGDYRIGFATNLLTTVTCGVVCFAEVERQRKKLRAATISGAE